MEKMTRAKWAGMTPAAKQAFFKEWAKLSPGQRERLQCNDGLTPQLIGLEGWRVEVRTVYGEVRRFIVGKSTGWAPCHLEIARRNSSGGGAAEKQYSTVTRLYYAK